MNNIDAMTVALLGNPEFIKRVSNGYVYDVQDFVNIAKELHNALSQNFNNFDVDKFMMDTIPPNAVV